MGGHIKNGFQMVAGPNIFLLALDFPIQYGPGSQPNLVPEDHGGVLGNPM